jgi:hypothetical protein
VNPDDFRAADGVVTVDPRSRTLAVRPAPDVEGYLQRVWRDGVRAQAAEASSHYGGTAPTVWARGAGESHLAWGKPTDDGGMQFRFGIGHPAYKRLVSTPGLRATVVVDTANRQICSVRFRGR